MENEMYNEKELKALEDEIRAMGIPYSANEPDDRYFANFRVHLMQRIEAKEKKKNIFALAWSWLSSSPLRSLSLGASLAGVIIAVLLIRPATEPPVAVVAPTVIPIENVTPPVVVPLPMAVKNNDAPKSTEKVVPVTKRIVTEPKNTNVAQTVKTTVTEDAANAAADFASMDEVLSSDDTDAPIDYAKLTEAELESVIAVAQEMN